MKTALEMWKERRVELLGETRNAKKHIVKIPREAVR